MIILGEAWRTCPLCGGELNRESWYDEEGVEAVGCEDCGAGWLGDEADCEPDRFPARDPAEARREREGTP